jgi:hypothetical protein
MIQLATDPTASRMSFRPEHGAGAAREESTQEARRGRTGHAWPFPSRYAPKPVRQEAPKAAGTESAS